MISTCEKSNNNYPRVLTISHNCFSKNGSNGRTLANLFIDWPKESIAQLYIYNELPNSDVCENYFRITDIEVLNAFVNSSSVGRVLTNKTVQTEDNNEKSIKLYRKHKKRTSLNYILRNHVWDSRRWQRNKLTEWINEFQPDIILLQIGDYAFLHRIALQIAEELQIPIILYNSEDYYFKDRKSISPIYYYYRRQYKNIFKRLLNYASCSIYNSKMLEQTYQDAFKHNSDVIMASSEVKCLTEFGNPTWPITIAYLGNLGVGRHEPIIEVAEVLQEISSDLFVDVYGKCPDDRVQVALQESKGIHLHGVVTYEDVLSIMKSCDILLHVENSSQFYQWDLKHAFSTKIADCLACGKCFLVYSPPNIASAKYLIENQAAYVVTNKQQLKLTLFELIKNPTTQNAFFENAINLVKKNHNATINGTKFKKLVVEIVNKES